MRKSVYVAVFGAIICLLFSSCGAGPAFKSVNELISPPLYYSEYADLAENFKKEVGNSITLCTPYSGEHTSAITVEDIDGDGTDEAIIFYKESTPDAVPRMRIFSDGQNGWMPNADLSGYGSGVDSFFLADMDADGITEIIVNWSMSGSAAKTMSVFRAPNNTLGYSEITNEMSFASYVVDMDGDGCDELFFIGQNIFGGTAQRTAKLLKISGGSVVILDEANADSDVSGYSSAKTEKLSENSPMKLYIDALRNDKQMITELFYWNAEKSELVTPFFDKETMSNTATLRNEPIECRDIDNDGSIEIPVQIDLNDEEHPEIDSETLPVTVWIDYDGEKIHTVAETFINKKDGYMVLLDESEKGELKARSYPAQSCVVLSDDIGDICSVLKITNERMESEPLEHYIPIFENDDSVICAYITQNGEDRGLNETALKEKIIRLN